MEKVIVSYSMKPDRKVKARLLAYAMGKTMSRFIEDLIDECWQRNAKKLKVDRLPKGYKRDVNKFIKTFDTK